MQIDTKTVVSMTEANQNFSKVTRLVDRYGQAVVFKNNSPKYLIIDFSLADQMSFALNMDVLASADKMMNQYDDTLRELAK
ncbi:MAG: type II toxin-antitoxin system Phd/YefM family antitoxin [Lachnospiraceae bacterium]|nr:type II toxin-antitoxin system Phd/YefM family antitoxin [Lachnospiraceae bacterium]